MAPLRFMDLDLEIATPMMTGGADQNAELRPPSFRGVMRLWLRALAGGMLGDDVPRVRHLETAVLGGGHQGSPTALRALGEPARSRIPVNPQDFPGFAYMLWSVYQMRRDCLLAGERFRLRLQTTPIDPPRPDLDGLSLDREAVWLWGLASFWLMVRLGSCGKRSRRGAGVLRIDAQPAGWPGELPPLVSSSSSPSELAEELARDLGAIRRMAGVEPPARIQAPSSFDILHPDTCSLFVLDRSFPSWWEALDAVGREFRAFRALEPNDYTGIKAILTGGRAAFQTVKRAVFGLPLPFFFSSLFRELTEKGVSPQEARVRSSAMVMPRRGDRRASPLFFRVNRLSGEESGWTVLLGLWRSQFLPDGVLTVRPRDRSLRPVTVSAPSDYSYMEQCLAHLGQTVAPLIPVAYQ